MPQEQMKASNMDHPTPDIVLTGQGKWASLLARGLKAHADLPVRVAPLDNVRDALDPSVWLTLARADLVVRVGFRPGARTWRGLLADSALRAVRHLHPGQSTAYYWIGTDVQGLARDADADSWPSWLENELARSVHAAVTDNLVKQLARFGVAAHMLPHPPMNLATGSDVPPFPAQFSVLTYIPDARREFYGSSAILDAARQLPGVDFKILGGTAGAGSPPNVEYLGWVRDLGRRYAETACVVRMVEHDGCGGTVLEALSYGRPVIYSQHRKDTIFVPFGDSATLAREIKGLHERHMAGELGPDQALARSTREFYAPERCYPRMAQWLRAAARRTS